MSDRTIREAVRQIVHGNSKPETIYIIDAEVVGVNKKARTCTCASITGDAPIDLNDVRLMAAVDDGLLIVPAAGSIVSVILSEKNTPFICQYSEVEEIVMRGGDLGGLIKVNDLVSRLNAIENAFNALNVKVAAIAPPALQPLTLTLKTQIENKNITHG